MIRGIERRKIFINDRDREDMLERLAKLLLFLRCGQSMAFMCFMSFRGPVLFLAAEEFPGDGARPKQDFMFHSADFPDQSLFVDTPHLIRHDLGILRKAAASARKKHLEWVNLSHPGCDWGND